MSAKSDPSVPGDAAKDVHNRVQWVYASRDHSELEQRYDQWAADYDSDLDQQFGWVGPQRAAETLARFVPRDARILDAGAGTGLVGKCLATLGYRDIAGIDLSPGMLKKAEEKGVYRELRKMDLAATLDLPTDSFDAVISVGVFTLGHVAPEGLRELIRVTRPGGHVVFSLRPDVYENGGFKEKLGEFESAGLWTCVEVGEPFQTLPKGEPDVYHRVWVYQTPR